MKQEHAEIFQMKAGMNTDEQKKEERSGKHWG